tara:strand:+ start:562 stop:732 length:171 start_codon:yes stop_codon:yes gene_type:complete
MNEDTLSYIDRLSKSITKRVLIDLVKDDEATDYRKNLRAILDLYDVLENRRLIKTD